MSTSKKQTRSTVNRGVRGGRQREKEKRVGGYIKTGAGACQVLRCTQCISVRHRGTPASRKSKYKRVHRRLLLKRKKGERLQNARFSFVANWKMLVHVNAI